MKIKKIFSNSKTYFIADIAANHDGSLIRAKKLIKLAAKAGANAAKFQHFKAVTIVSQKGFEELGKLSHQSKWKKSIFQVYKEASLNPKWTKELYKECKKNKIEFMTAPYDLEYVNLVNNYISAYKIGSGDLTWHKIIRIISKKKKPVILATGASEIDEVKKSVNLIKKNCKKLILMQCNTNYTYEEDNFKSINLNVIKEYKKIFKNKVILGLSDHTAGHSTVLGAIALGARVIEKHFTDNNLRHGPDHKFSMNFRTWKNMVEESRRLELSLGDGVKKIEKNEKQTAIVQLRAYYALKQIKKGEKILDKHIFPLRPRLKNSFSPDQEKKIVGKRAKTNISLGECIKKNQIK